MDVPNRMMLREWLAYLQPEDIMKKMDIIEKEHGLDVRLDLRVFLNADKHEGTMSPAEESLLKEHRAAKIQALRNKS